MCEYLLLITLAYFSTTNLKYEFKFNYLNSFDHDTPKC